MEAEQINFKSPDQSKKKYRHHCPVQRMDIFTDKKSTMESMKENLIDPIVLVEIDETDALLDTMIELYDRMSLKDVGKEVGLSTASVFRRLKKAGVELRGRGVVI